MSLITRCPACGTMFKVVADQLRISEGWVRCGHCAHVFDASAHMVDGTTAAQPPALPADEPAAPPPVSSSTLLVAAATAPASDGDSDNDSDNASVFPSELPSESPLDQPFVFRRSDLAQSDDAPSVAPPIAQESSGWPSSSARRDEEHDDSESPDAAPLPAEEIGFLRQARRRAFWRRPLVRACMVLLALVLGAALALQIAVHDRDRLALTQPQLKPLLQQLCGYLQCTIGAPRQIEAIVIDSSTFAKLRGDTYRLSFTLKNGAGTPVAAPAIELTLTDTQDQPLLRRVLTPPELGAASALIPAGGEWTGSAALAVAGNGSLGRIAGYRLLAFYP